MIYLAFTLMIDEVPCLASAQWCAYNVLSHYPRDERNYSFYIIPVATTVVSKNGLSSIGSKAVLPTVSDVLRSAGIIPLRLCVKSIHGPAASLRYRAILLI